MIINVSDEAEMKEIGEKIGKLLKGGEVIELVGDVGAGKTTLTMGIAIGLGVTDNVQSPSFTISRVYLARDDLQLAHYDFYRLSDAGLMANELDESINNTKTITIIEWGGIANDVLPEDRITIDISAPTESSRILDISDNMELN